MIEMYHQNVKVVYWHADIWLKIPSFDQDSMILPCHWLWQTKTWLAADILLWAAVCTAVTWRSLSLSLTVIVFEAGYLHSSVWQGHWPISLDSHIFWPDAPRKVKGYSAMRTAGPAVDDYTKSQVNDWHDQVNDYLIHEKDLRKKASRCQHCSDGLLKNGNGHRISNLMAFGRLGSPRLPPRYVPRLEALQPSHFRACHSSVLLRGWDAVKKN